MIVRILACAEEELDQAVSYYNEQCPGLGFELAAEVKSALARIADFPDAWPAFSPRSRRCLLDRFPYGLLYHQSGEEILILAVMHLRRSPRRWKERLPPTVSEPPASYKRRKRRR
jgi:plasmid stabilization system protein ParE